MVFDKSACVIRKMYCGDGKLPRNTHTKKYSRIGTRSECLKKGFGVATWEHRKKKLSRDSLQQIMYIGPVHEENFKKRGISSIKTLLSKLKNMTMSEKEKLINKSCKKNNGTIDQRAVNAVLLFLNDNGIKNLPPCKIVKE